MLARYFLLALAAALPFAAGCQSASYAERGAGLGALAGAATGAAIGEHNGNAAAGALLGTAVGAVTGAAVGDTVDYEVARSQAVIEQRLGRQMASAVSLEDAIAMSQANLSNEVIIAHIRNKGVARPLEVVDLIALRDAGVSDPVIRAMQTAGPPRTAQPVSYPRRSPPVIVEEHYYGPPACFDIGPPRYRYRRHHHHHRRPGFSFSIHN